MEFTPVQNLPCLGPDDYAAYATYMQCLAEELEGRFTEKNDALLGVRNNYAGVWRNTVALTSDGGGLFTFGPNQVANLFWNDPFNTPSTGSGAADDPVRFQFPGMVAGGLYQVGGTVFYNQGATANSTRQFQGLAYFSAITGLIQGVSINAATEESLSGGEGLIGDYQIELTNREITPSSGNFGTPIGFIMSGFEADAGAITVPIGGVTLYAILLGTNTLIGGA